MTADAAAIQPGKLPDGTLCHHEGETSTYCTKCWTNLYEARIRAALPVPPPSQGMWPLRVFCYAGFCYRVLAAAIDASLLCWLLVLVSTASRVLGFLFGVVSSWLYFAILESSVWQGTPGKMWLGLRVVDYAGSRISFGRASARYWAKMLSTGILLIGFLMAAFTERRQGLHDKLAETLVVKD